MDPHGVWILLVMITSNGASPGVAFNSIRFADLHSCNIAAQVVRGQERARWAVVSVRCVPEYAYKGESK